MIDDVQMAIGQSETKCLAEECLIVRLMPDVALAVAQVLEAAAVQIILTKRKDQSRIDPVTHKSR